MRKRKSINNEYKNKERKLEDIIDDRWQNKFDELQSKLKNANSLIALNNHLRPTFISNIIGKNQESQLKFIEFLSNDGFLQLQILQKNDINLVSISNILNGSGTKVMDNLNSLFSILFIKDDKRQYIKSEKLQILEKEGVNLTSIFSILNRSGAKVADVFNTLFSLLFHKKKAKYIKSTELQILEEEGVNLTSIFSILKGSGAKVADVFNSLLTKSIDSTLSQQEEDKNKLLINFSDNDDIIISQITDEFKKLVLRY